MLYVKVKKSFQQMSFYIVFFSIFAEDRKDKWNDRNERV
jgi:hypothetical protein